MKREILLALYLFFFFRCLAFLQLSGTECHLPITAVEEQDSVFEAMEDVMNHVKDMKEDSMQQLFIDFLLEKRSTFQTSSSLGETRSCPQTTQEAKLAAHVILGDIWICNSSQSFLSKGPDSCIAAEDCSKATLKRLFYEAWKTGLRKAKGDFQRIKSAPRNRFRKDIPQFRKMPPAENIEIPVTKTGLRDSLDIVKLSNELSSVFLNYPQLEKTHVDINLELTDIYRFTSDGQKTLSPCVRLTITAFATMPTDKRHMNSFNYEKTYASFKEISKQEIITDLNSFAQYLTRIADCDCADELYIGPIIYENLSAFRNIIGSCRLLHPDWNIGWTCHNIGKPVMDKSFSIRQLGNVSVYNGTRLMGYCNADADGIKPMNKWVVKDGRLTSVLSGRIPVPDGSCPTGNEHINRRNLACGYNPGVLQIASTKKYKYHQLYKKAMKEARRQKLKYFFIVRETPAEPVQILKVNAATGKQTLLFGRASWQNIQFGGVSDEEYVVNRIHKMFGGLAESYIIPKAFFYKKAKVLFM